MFEFSLFILFSLLSSGSCYQRCFAKPLQKNPDAEARFSVIISLRETAGVEECKDIKVSAIMDIVAIDWAVSRLNNVTLVPGVKFGYDVYDDCGVERYSMYSALDTIDYYFPDHMTSCSGNSSRYFLGILGPSRSQTTQQVLSIMDNTDIPVVSPFATFPDLRNSKNFLRTIPSDDDQVNVFVELMVKHKWNYVVAMYTTDNYGQNGITKIVQLAKLRNICVNVIPGFSVTETFDDSSFRDSVFDKLLNHVANTTDGTLGVLFFGQRNVIHQFLNKMQLTADIKTNLKNIKWILSESIGTRTSILTNANDVTNEAMTVSMASLNIPDIEDHLNRMQTSSALDDINSLVQSFGPVNNEDWKDYIVSVLDSAFAITTSLKTAFDTRCKGYKVICDGFDTYFNSHKLDTILSTRVNYSSLGPNISPLEFIDHRRVVEFDTTGDLIAGPHTPLYNVNMYKDSALIQVGEFVNGSLAVNSLFPKIFPSSICQKGCEQCVETPSIVYEFVEGDVYIIGLFSLHRLSDNPFACGVFRNLSYDVLSVEAFLNSIKESYAETGIKFGGIAFDDCYSPSRATMIISDIFTGKLKIPSESNPIDPSKIIGVVGPFPSGVTVPVTFFFSSINLPSVSYASTSPDLDDKDINFPYFFRTVPSDVDQAQAMVEILKTIDRRSVGLVYVNNNYGSKGKDAFKKFADVSGICVIKEIEVKQENNDLSNHNVYLDLQEVKNSGTNLFVYFGTEGRMMDILSYVRQQSNGVISPYVFIGSDDWADSRNIKNAFGDMVTGSLSFKIKTRNTQTNFIENIVKKTSSVDTAGFWYKQFFRNYFQCHFPDDFVKTFPTLCSENTTISDTSGIMADGRISHSILAVKALTNGIALAKQQLCSGETEFPCPVYKRRTDIVREEILKVTLLDDNQISFRVFDKNGNGDTGFQILQITQDGRDYVYTEVGSYDNSNLVFKLENVKATIGDRMTVSKCEATNVDTTTSSSMTSDTEEQFRIADIVIVAILGSICVVLTIVIIAIVFCFWKKITGLQKMLDETKARITYYNEIGSTKRHKKQPVYKKNGDMVFDNPIFPNGGLLTFEQPGQHYLPLHDSDPTHSHHRYEGNNIDLIHQTQPKQISVSQELLPTNVRPDLPPRDIPQKKETSKSDSDIHSSFPVIRSKMGNYPSSNNQPRMGTAIQTTPTDSLHSQGSVFNVRNYSASKSDDIDRQNINPQDTNLQNIIPQHQQDIIPQQQQVFIPHQQQNIVPQQQQNIFSQHQQNISPLHQQNIISQQQSSKSPSKSQPTTPRTENQRPSQSSSGKGTPHSSPLSHKGSIHSQFSGDTFHLTGNLSPQRRKRLKSFSSEEKQKISRV